MIEQIVHTSAFEILGSLWVCKRILFEMNNSSLVFKCNAVEMPRDLYNRVAKVYFNGIIGKAAKRDYTLKNVWRALL